MYGNILSWQTLWKIFGAPIKLARAEDRVAENIPTYMYHHIHYT